MAGIDLQEAPEVAVEEIVEPAQHDYVPLPETDVEEQLDTVQEHQEEPESPAMLDGELDEGPSNSPPNATAQEQDQTQARQLTRDEQVVERFKTLMQEAGLAELTKEHSAFLEQNKVRLEITDLKPGEKQGWSPDGVIRFKKSDMEYLHRELTNRGVSDAQAIDAVAKKLLPTAIAEIRKGMIAEELTEKFGPEIGNKANSYFETKLIAGADRVRVAAQVLDGNEHLLQGNYRSVLDKRLGDLANLAPALEKQGLSGIEGYIKSNETRPSIRLSNVKELAPHLRYMQDLDQLDTPGLEGLTKEKFHMFSQIASDLTTRYNVARAYGTPEEMARVKKTLDSFHKAPSIYCRDEFNGINAQLKELHGQLRSPQIDADARSEIREKIEQTTAKLEPFNKAFYDPASMNHFLATAAARPVPDEIRQYLPHMSHALMLSKEFAQKAGEAGKFFQDQHGFEDTSKNILKYVPPPVKPAPEIQRSRKEAETEKVDPLKKKEEAPPSENPVEPRPDPKKIVEATTTQTEAETAAAKADAEYKKMLADATATIESELFKEHKAALGRNIPEHRAQREQEVASDIAKARAIISAHKDRADAFKARIAPLTDALNQAGRRAFAEALGVKGDDYKTVVASGVTALDLKKRMAMIGAVGGAAQQTSDRMLEAFQGIGAADKDGELEKIIKMLVSETEKFEQSLPKRAQDILKQDQGKKEEAQPAPQRKPDKEQPEAAIRQELERIQSNVARDKTIKGAEVLKSVTDRLKAYDVEALPNDPNMSLDKFVDHLPLTSPKADKKTIEMVRSNMRTGIGYYPENWKKGLAEELEKAGLGKGKPLDIIEKAFAATPEENWGKLVNQIDRITWRNLINRGAEALEASRDPKAPPPTQREKYEAGFNLFGR
ncbi:hypothetical protein OAO01_04105 [Oligoflexia bacterium]|nr:hypothetical protein [Oligoflexia bacterium]